MDDATRVVLAGNGRMKDKCGITDRAFQRPLAPTLSRTNADFVWVTPAAEKDRPRMQ